MGEHDQLPYRHLVRVLSDTDRFPQPPAGIVLARFDPAQDAAAVHALLAPTYDEIDDGLELEPFDEWRNALVADAEYRSEVVFLARSTQGELAGVSQSWGNGFIKDLAVSAQWRKRGIAEFLLQHTFAHFVAAGLDNVQLKVTRGNPTGAERLYARLGFVDLAE